MLEDARWGATDHLRPEVAELAQRGRVERAGLDAADAELAQPGAHLARGARGERHREDRRGRVDPAAHAVRDAVRDGARLAGPGAREHADRSRQGECDRALVGVEGFEDLVC